MFREDFEFVNGAGPSHLGAHGSSPEPAAAPEPEPEPVVTERPDPGVPNEPRWTAEAKKELKKIPFFVRGKARKNTERFARERGFPDITLETLYDAKAYFSAR